MATIITCETSADECPTTWETYTQTKQRLEARAARSFFRKCNSEEICYTVEQEICDGIDGGYLRVLDCGRIVLNDPTPNTVTDNYGCADTTFVQDWSFDIDMFYRYHPDNEAFMIQLCNQYTAEFGWICCDNLMWIPDTTDFQIDPVGPIDDGGYKAWRIDANWTQECGVLESSPARSPLAQ